MPTFPRRALLAAGVAAVPWPLAAATLDGVTMPDSRTLDGVALRLNGMGLRTYSILGIHIYVAGLYLAQPSNDAEQIMASAAPKVLDFTFLRDIDAEDGRKSWRESLDDNCVAPCRLAPSDMATFLAGVPAVKRGDTGTLLFHANGTLDLQVNGRTLGVIRDPSFARTVMATFIGTHPSSGAVKRALLGLR